MGSLKKYQTDFCNSTQSKLCLIGLCSSENEEIIAIDKHKCTNSSKKPFENIRLLKRLPCRFSRKATSVRSAHKPEICYAGFNLRCRDIVQKNSIRDTISLKVIYPAVYVEFKRFGDILDLRLLVVHRTKYFSRDFNRTSILCNFSTHLWNIFIHQLKLSKFKNSKIAFIKK